MGDRPNGVSDTGPAGSEWPRSAAEPVILAFGPFHFDATNRLLFSNGDEIALQPKPLGVLTHLLSHAGKIVSKQQLLDEVWDGSVVADASITEVVSVLRRALGDDPRQPTYIETVHRRGYRFIAPVSVEGELPGDSARSEPVVAEAEPEARASWPPRRPLSAGFAAFAAVAAGLAVVLFAWRAGTSVDGESSLPVVPFRVAPPADTRVLMGERPQILMLPDGSGVMFAAIRERSGAWYVQSFDTFETRMLPGSDEVTYAGPWFAMDAQRIGFLSGPGIKTLSMRDGTVDLLCSECTDRIGQESNAGATWSPDGTIVYANGELHRLLPTGEFEVIPAPGFDHSRGVYMWPSFLPGYEWVLATARTTAAIRGASIVAVNVESGETRQLVEDGTNPRYVPTGHLVFARDGNLMAVPFDLDSLEARGSPAVVVEGVMMSATLGAAQYSISDNGTLAYQPGEIIRREFPILAVGRDGGDVQPLFERRRDFRELRFSPDGKRLAVTVGDGPYRKIWVYDLDTERITGGNGQLSRTSGDEGEPAWDPLGTRVAFVSSEKDTNTLRVARADRFSFENDNTAIVSSTDPIALPSWSADGRTIAYQTWKNGQWDIWLVDVDDPVPRPFLESELDEMAPSFSPDGRWLAYSGFASPGGGQIYVTDYPNRTRAVQVSDGGGYVIRWAADSRQLFASVPVDGRLRLWAVPVAPGPEPEFGPPQALPQPPGQGFIDVSPDGQRIIRAVDRRSSPITSPSFNVVLNWFEELERLVPTQR